MDPLITEEDHQKRKERMERFGIPEDNTELRTTLRTAEDRVKQKDRIKRFGAFDEPRSYWQESIEPSEEKKEDTLYVFGVDFLSTAGVFRHFESYDPVSVTWIDDSSCIVKFPHNDKVKSVLENLPLTGFDETENKSVKCLGYYHKDQEIPIYIRYATATDVKTEEKKPSKYYNWRNSNNRRHEQKQTRRRYND